MVCLGASVRVGREFPDRASCRGDPRWMEHLCRVYVAICSTHLSVLKPNRRISPPFKKDHIEVNKSINLGKKCLSSFKLIFW